MSKRFLSITLAALTLCFFASSCVKEDGFENRVREIVGTGGEETRIATVEEQVKGMQNTITQLQSAQTALEQRADQIRIELTTAQGDITDLEAELENVNETIETIQESIESLEDGIADLRQYVRDTIATVTGWVTATFATIEKTKEVDSILAASIDTVRLKYPKDISDSLKKAVAGIQTWVNGKLTGYWTIAQTQARLDSLGKIEKEDSTALAASITQAKLDLTTAYKDAIKTAIDSLGGALNDTINNRIARASATLNTRIDGINTRLTALEKTVKNLVARIQGIEVVPEYQDGSVEIKKNSTVTVSFEVRPASLADSIVKKKGAAAFILQAVETKAVTKAVTYYNLTVTNPKVGTDSLLTLTVGKGDLPDEFFVGTKFFNARLRISDGNTDKTSAYFPLTVAPLEDLSANGTSNCYIVSKAGDYKFKVTKGNSTDVISGIKGVKVLWESFGTSQTISEGDILGKNSVSYSGNYITFSTNSTFAEGNAVIAAYSDASCTDGNVLWSWHIWCTDQPKEQKYNNNAGTMMDRYLGATSADKGKVSALGLMYQWGRKDPFLGANGITSTTTQAASTLNTWPTAAAQDNSSDRELNLKTSIKKPTTFITNGAAPYDWYCTSSANKNDNLWKNATGSAKTIYDPCPVGWRVPDGGTKSDGGVWAKAFNSEVQLYESTFANGFDFGATSNKLVQSGTCCWYPAAGYRSNSDYSFDGVGGFGFCWSCTPSSTSTYLFYYNLNNHVFPVRLDSDLYRARGYNVRCLKE